ncbi:Catechol 2,3-dioxygenase [Faunimonas pinastri]|uniref:Catechol 2,3-dioxygenase n=1 Tax=Faunimonas pinastri TaxID=1855383 RepID=A0A1H9JK40_9HYPH|nr:VOC family protein [Faunimonas pinastri]SEQ87361.1 Catechol 2,3-dioxygenase [Faunimonas pinastri]
MSSANNLRGIDHIGVAVTNIEEATEFLVTAFGAETIYETLPRGADPQQGPEAEAKLGLAPGAKVTAIRMLQLCRGPGIELFQISAPDQRPPARASDLGLQHLAIYVEDMNAATSRFAAAGGELLTGPHPLPPLEAGRGNVFRYGRTPWGMTVEFITYPSPQGYCEETPLRRWTPEE